MGRVRSRRADQERTGDQPAENKITGSDPHTSASGIGANGNSCAGRAWDALSGWTM
jgi:hypothetical protein